MAKAKETSKERKPVGYSYVGNGAHIPGIPRRDLAASDLVRFRVAVAEHEGSETFKALYAPVYEKDGDEVNDA